MLDRPPRCPAREGMHKAVIAEMDREKAAGGSAPYDFSRASLEDVWFNTDEAYYMEVEDRVFSSVG